MENGREPQLCLKWDKFQTNMADTFDQLRKTEVFVDATLTADGHAIKCHKMVLSACSPYFQQLFADNSCQHPIVILKDMKAAELDLVVEYMYRGEVQVPHEHLEAVLQAAETLGVRGLVEGADKAWPPNNISSSPTNLMSSHQGGRQDPFCGNCSNYGSQAKKPRLLEEMVEKRGPIPNLGPPNPRGVPLLADPRTGRQTSPDIDSFTDIRPDILEMIKEEQKAKLLEPSQNWTSHSTPNSSVPGGSYCYQNQLQSMWQKCWSQNASLFNGVRYRERGPMKSWRSETMAEAIWAVLQEGLSLSQAARKHDIPYPTFVLYANRVHNMLGPSPLNGYPGMGDLRPKGRGRPQRILLGQWPEDHVRQVIRAVVFRDQGQSGAPTPTPGPSVRPTPASSPQTFPTDLTSPKVEPIQDRNDDASPPSYHPLAAESMAAQANFEAQMKSLYSNPFASQLLAASSRMFNHFDMNPFLQTNLKQEVPDDAFADADDDDKDDTSQQDDSRKINSGEQSKQNPRSSPSDLSSNQFKSIDAIASKLVNTAGGADPHSYNTFRSPTETFPWSEQSIERQESITPRTESFDARKEMMKTTTQSTGRAEVDAIANMLGSTSGRIDSNRHNPFRSSPETLLRQEQSLKRQNSIPARTEPFLVRQDNMTTKTPSPGRSEVDAIPNKYVSSAGLTDSHSYNAFRSSPENMVIPGQNIARPDLIPARKEPFGVRKEMMKQKTPSPGRSDIRSSPGIPSSSSTPSPLGQHLLQSEINENVFNCSNEIRKTMKSVNTEIPLLSPCSQEQKSV